MRLKLPEAHTQLRSTLGVLNYYRSHVHGYTMIAKPLTDILSSKKSKGHFHLGDDTKKAFEQLKELVRKAPVLVPPRFGEPFLLYTLSAVV